MVISANRRLCTFTLDTAKHRHYYKHTAMYVYNAEAYAHNQIY